MVKSVKQWSKYIARALYTRTHWQHNKILMLSDSTTAASKWFNIHLPNHDLDFICAKAWRFLSWSDKVAYTAEWPMVVSHLHGEFNFLAHLLSHIGDLLTDMYKNSKPAPRTPHGPPPPALTPNSLAGKNRPTLPYSAPIDPQFDPSQNATAMAISLHSYHGGRPVICKQYEEPPGFITQHLNIPVDSCAIIASAYHADTNPFHKVHLKHVYAVATNDIKVVEKSIQERIR